jgi:serine/threonine protein kinase
LEPWHHGETLGLFMSGEQQQSLEVVEELGPDREESETPTVLLPNSTSLGATSNGSRRRSSARYTVFDSDEILMERYRVVEELGRGAMGIVYRAWDLKLQREVALKTLRDENDEDPVRGERFRREIESLSGLQHSHIVGVHDAGVFEGRFWFVMDYIEGRSLSQLLKSGALEPRRAFSLMLPVAQAVAYAHSQGIVHRDIKPENILVDANDTPYLTDFGLACRLSQETRLTATGHAVGTPAFMAPEQIVGSNKAGEGTDVYAVGVTLYECLTGALPFAGSASYAELVYAIVNEEPPLPRTVRPEIARDAEVICMACLEKDPAHRYTSADDLTMDMERFLRGEAVRASSSAWWRLLRLVRRHWSLVLGLSIGIAGLCGALGVVWSQQETNDRIRRMTQNLERERETLLRVYKRTVKNELLKNQRDSQLAETVLWRDLDWDLDCYKNVVKVDPNYWEAHYWRARDYIAKATKASRDGQLSKSADWGRKALSELRALKKVGPRTAAFLVLEAAVYGQIFDDWTQARDRYRQALEMDDQSSAGLFAKSMGLSLAGAEAPALAVLEKLCKDDPAPLGALLLRVERLAMVSQVEKARAQFDRLQKLWPLQSVEKAPTLWLLGFNQWNMERLSLLISILERDLETDQMAGLKKRCVLLRSQKKNEWSDWLLAKLLMREKNYLDAGKLLSKSVEAYPQAGRLWLLKAQLAKVQALPKEQTRCLLKAKEILRHTSSYRRPSNDR